MSFIEKEKKRKTEQDSIEKENLKKSISKQKKEQKDFIKKRKLIKKKVGPYLKKLLRKVEILHGKAIRSKLHCRFPSSWSENARDWVWEIDWEDLTPRLWGHFKVITYGSKKKTIGSNGTIRWYPVGDGSQLRYIFCDTSIYIKVLIDSNMKNLTIIARAEDEVTRGDRDTVEEGWSEETDTDCIHADYLENGITLPIENNREAINILADKLIEIFYTWQLKGMSQTITNADEESKEAKTKYKEIEVMKKSDILKYIVWGIFSVGSLWYFWNEFWTILSALRSGLLDHDFLVYEDLFVNVLAFIIFVGVNIYGIATWSELYNLKSKMISLIPDPDGFYFDFREVLWGISAYVLLTIILWLLSFPLAWIILAITGIDIIPLLTSSFLYLIIFGAIYGSWKSCSNFDYSDELNKLLEGKK